MFVRPSAMPSLVARLRWVMRESCSTASSRRRSRCPSTSSSALAIHLLSRLKPRRPPARLRRRREEMPYFAENPLVVSLSNHEPNPSSFDRPVLSRRLILRQARDERGVRTLEQTKKHSGKDDAREREDRDH